MDCLADGEWHSWWDYVGQHGSGRCCERCLMAQDSSEKTVFKLRPRCVSATPTAVAILESWRAELARVTTAGGCVAGGEHSWVDVKKTLVRLTGEGRCCEKCGLVESGDAAAEGAPKAMVVLCLPNMMGLFGPAISKEYRTMYGGGGQAPPRGGVGALGAVPREGTTEKM